ncbi:HEAT repeat domain-containing protein [Streptomyces sp. NPDC014892]|uniref:HEAT repeat domain-containing protein n=1 Tax=Streptomyces sp. NPDC014892 TaxID=3364930 RepID=UPI0037002013
MEPLGRAARDDDEAAVRALLDGGADVNGRSPGGLTALMLAAGAGAHHAADALRENGAYVALRDEQGRSALDFAEEGAERHPDEPGYLMIVTDLEKYFGRRADFATTMERAIRFGDPQNDIWFRATWTLDGWADDETVAGAETALNSAQARERYFAADLLSFFCLYNASLRNGVHRTRQAAALLRARMAVEEHPAVLGLVIRGLVRQAGFADDAPGILRYAGHPHPEVRAAVAYAVEVSSDPKDREASRAALEVLLALARDPCAEVRGHAVATLSHLFDPAVPVPAVHTALRRALYDPDPSVVHDAACALGKLDGGRPLPFRAEQILVRRYLDEPRETRSYERAYRVIERWPRERLWDVRDSLPDEPE